MSANRPTTVKVETTLRLICQDTTVVSMPSVLFYDSANPYAVSAGFYECGEWIHWEFARETLVVGLDEPAGIGDVRVWPWATPRGDFVALALSPCSTSTTLFEVPRSVLVRFLRRTFVVVPRGEESKFAEAAVDAAIDRIFATS